MNTYFITICTIAIALAAQAGAEGMMPDVGSLAAMPEGLMGNMIPTDFLGGQEAETDGADDTEEADDTEDSDALFKRGLLSSDNDGNQLLSADVNTNSRKSSHNAQDKSQNDGLLGDLLKRGYAPSHSSKTQEYGSGSDTSPMSALPMGGGMPRFPGMGGMSSAGGMPSMMSGMGGGAPKFPGMGGMSSAGGLPSMMSGNGGGMPKFPGMGGMSSAGGLPSMMGGMGGGAPKFPGMGGMSSAGGLPSMMGGMGSSPTYEGGEVTDAKSHKPKHHGSHYSRGLLSSALPAGGLTDALPLGGSNGFLKVRRSNQE